MEKEDNIDNSKKEFALTEYKALREEIVGKMDKQYQILSLGIGGITIIFGVIFQLKLYELFLILPFLIFANAYLYRSEYYAIINAGSYIKKIEDTFYKNNSIGGIDNNDECSKMGWEKYIDFKRKRSVYVPFMITAHIIFGALFIMCAIGACYYISIPRFFLNIAIFIYLIIISIWIDCIYNDLKINNNCDNEKEPEHKQQ